MTDTARLSERLALLLARRDVDGVTNAVGGLEDARDLRALDPGFRVLEERMRELMLLTQLNHWRGRLANMTDAEIRALNADING